MSDIWTVLSAVAALMGTLFAAGALLQNSQTTRRTETFQHLRDVNLALTAMGEVDVRDLQLEILRYFERKQDDISAEATRYKQFLDTLELVSFAVEEGAVDRTIASKYLRSIVRGHMVPIPFLREFQAIAHNQHSYEYLLRLAVQEQRRLPPMKGYENV